MVIASDYLPAIIYDVIIYLRLFTCDYLRCDYLPAIIYLR